MNKLILTAAIFVAVWIPCAASEPDSADIASDETAETVHVESLIAQSQGMERRFRQQNLFFNDAELETYLDDILKKLTTTEEQQLYNLRIRIVKSRAVNAFAAPDGAIYITTGLLSRVTNEVQIAAVLGHELGHIMLNHTERNLAAKKEIARAEVRALQKSSRKGSSRSNGRKPTDTPPVFRAEYNRIFSDGVGFGGDVFSAPAHDYLQVLETEADSMGIARLLAAGYLSGSEAGAGGITDDGIETAYFSVKLWSVILYETSFVHAMGIFSLVEEQLERLLAVDECDPAALVMRGDMERLMSPRSTISFQWYEKALQCDPRNSGALLSLGLAHHAVGHKDKAREFLKKYIEISGDDGIDINMVTEVIRRCE